MEKVKFDELFVRKSIEEGMWISIPVDKNRNYTIDFDKYDHQKVIPRRIHREQQFSNKDTCEIFAKVATVDNDGFLKCIGEISPFCVQLEGQLGFLFGPDELNKLLYKMYAWNQNGIIVRNITSEDTKEPELIMADTWYWIATRGIRQTIGAGYELVLKTGYKDYIRDQELVLSDGTPRLRTCYARPVFFITNNTSMNISVLIDEYQHNGKEKGTAYKLIFE